MGKIADRLFEAVESGKFTKEEALERLERIRDNLLHYTRDRSNLLIRFKNMEKNEK